jgi:DNA-binding transcriptional ArsR family regulator
MTGQTENMTNDTEKIEQHFGQVSSLIGERSRAIMLWNLLDGRAYTATELSGCADISAQAASNHLSKLVKANLLAVDNQGRHKYYRYKNDKVAQVIETIASLLPMNNPDEQKNNFPLDGIKYARTCYDHLAGKAGVAIANGLLQKKILVEQMSNYSVSAQGAKWFLEIGIDVDAVRQMKRKFAYPCLDWSERKHHLAGALGSVFLDTIANKDWIRKTKQSREVIITGIGKRELSKRLDIEL